MLDHIYKNLEYLIYKMLVLTQEIEIKELNLYSNQIKDTTSSN